METNLSVTLWYTMRTVNPRYQQDEVYGFKHPRNKITAAVGV